MLHRQKNSEGSDGQKFGMSTITGAVGIEVIT